MKLEGYIYLNNVRFYAFHEVMPQEQKVGGEFLVKKKKRYQIDAAMQSNENAETLNYSEL